MALSLILVAERSVRRSDLSGYGLDEKNCSRIVFAGVEIFVRLGPLLTTLTEFVDLSVSRRLCVYSGECRNTDEPRALAIGGSS